MKINYSSCTDHGGHSHGDPALSDGSGSADVELSDVRHANGGAPVQLNLVCPFLFRAGFTTP